ncbi:MAG: FAD-dependent monooxygenase [Hyphomicrobiaceae bacterium]|nr:FAD-dependent monooxygenase [Hyphomicrobiaceae bacterium]
MTITSTSACMVVGTGPAGLATALALAAVGAEVTLAGPPAPAAGAGDTRTAALFSGSIALLRSLGVWEGLEEASGPIRAIRVVDDTGWLLRAPEVLFQASEIGERTFGWNVPNAALTAALWEGVRRSERIAVVETARVAGLETGAGGVSASTAEGGTIAARLVAAADGRQSVCRAAAGIGTTAWEYDQAAIAARFEHGREHGDVSTELHRASGPLTTVPLPGLASGLVWVERPAIARQLAALDDDGFRVALETRLQGLLGRVGEVGPRRLFPLSGLSAEAFARSRVALVGEAGHVIPPIGAQGLNLGLRDAAALADCVAAAMAKAEDIGGPETMRRYHEWRKGDVESRILAVDLMNRTLLSTLLPVSLLRGFGLHVIRAFGPLKRELIRRGLEPAGPRPRLMEGAAPRDREVVKS